MKFRGDPQTEASYSYHMTRTDFFWVAVAMMKDYQNQTCVDKYLKKIQKLALRWDKYGLYKKMVEYILVVVQ